MGACWGQEHQKEVVSVDKAMGSAWSTRWEGLGFRRHDFDAWRLEVSWLRRLNGTLGGASMAHMLAITVGSRKLNGSRLGAIGWSQLAKVTHDHNS